MVKAKVRYLAVRTHGLYSHLIDLDEMKSWALIDSDEELFNKMANTDYGAFFEGPQDLSDVSKVEDAIYRSLSVRFRRLLSLSRGTKVEALIKNFLSKYDIENLRRIVFSLTYGRTPEELYLLPIGGFKLDIGKLSKTTRVEHLIDLLEDRGLAKLIQSWYTSDEREPYRLDLNLDSYYVRTLLAMMEGRRKVIKKRSPAGLLIWSYAESYIMESALKALYLDISGEEVANIYGRLPFRRLMGVIRSSNSIKELLENLLKIEPYKPYAYEIMEAMREVGEPWVIEHTIEKRIYVESLRISLKQPISEAYILKYLNAVEWEAQNVKTILLGRISGISKDTLYKLLELPTTSL